MNSASLDGYGSVRKLAVVPNVTGNQDSFERKAARKAELVKLESTQSAEVEKSALENAVKKLNDFVAPAVQAIRFELDQNTERMVVKVIDSVSQRVLRQIPNEQVLVMSQTLDKLQGLVVNHTA
ncbi:MAG: flagellar protein FlaG [Sulfuritalea sp.]|jgi:flagellar protein FlaG|nr:flagellar protein FlaG [Sulfuritalea sp.]